ARLGRAGNHFRCGRCGRLRGSEQLTLDLSSIWEEHEPMFMFWRRLVWMGLALWAVGTAVVRLAGQRVLASGEPGRVALLFAVSFFVMAVLVRRILRGSGVPTQQWPAAAAFLILPTLVLDALTSAFFPSVFPNIDSARAGMF